MSDESGHPTNDPEQLWAAIHELRTMNKMQFEEVTDLRQQLAAATDRALQSEREQTRLAEGKVAATMRANEAEARLKVAMKLMDKARGQLGPGDAYEILDRALTSLTLPSPVSPTTCTDERCKQRLNYAPHPWHDIQTEQNTALSAPSRVGETTCGTCAGTGRYVRPSPSTTFGPSVNCPTCGGTGKTKGAP